MKVINLTYLSTNYYLLQLNDGWLMIDSGLPDTFSQLLQLLNQKGISVNEINHLIVTHYHPDHAGLAQNLKDFGTNLIVHECQLPFIKELNQSFKKNPKAYFKDIMPSNTTIVTGKDSRSFLKSIGIDGEIVTTPGHTDDSVTLILDDTCAFIGDLPPYSDTDDYDDYEIEDSWDMIKKCHVKTIYPGHGDSYKLY
ncbi:MAG: MBL fold metallo-hydrolase [Mobilitalea sp.]